jgi:hypothetical protein
MNIVSLHIPSEPFTFIRTNETRTAITAETPEPLAAIKHPEKKRKPIGINDDN